MVQVPAQVRGRPVSVQSGPSRDDPRGASYVICDVEGCQNWCIPTEHSTGLVVPSWPRWSTVIAARRARLDICPLHEMPVPVQDGHGLSTAPAATE